MKSVGLSDTIDLWLKVLDQYNFPQLCRQPAPGSWSLGQVYMHLIDTARYHLEQIGLCLTSPDNQQETMSSRAKEMFQNNSFPDMIIEGPPSNATTPQPDSKAALIKCLLELKQQIKEIEPLISASSFRGKTAHPGLHYFNAAEWYQFAEMHFRHHLRQKQRMEEFLSTGEGL